MKKTISIFALFLVIYSLKAQSDLSFIQVDTSTYSAYLNSDWERIIKIGEQAVDKKIDYYYLRLRIAYAYFIKNRYRQAIPHYEKALEYSQNDAIASEYLYYSYLYSGRINDAQKLKSHFSSALKKIIDKGEPKVFTEFGTYLTFGNGVSDQLKEEQIQNAPTSIEGSQILPNKMFNFNLSFNHKIGSSLLARHNINLLYKDEYALAVVEAIPYLSESQTVRQFNYHLALDVTPFYGFTLSPSVSYINYRIPIFYDYITHNEAAIGLKVKKQFGRLEAGLAFAHGNFNLSKQNTAGFLLSIYPFGNLNIYYTGAIFNHVQSQNSINETQYIQSHKTGVKVFKNLWIEGMYVFGGFTNFYDSFSELTYNSLEKHNSIYGINLVVPLYKSGSSIFMGFRNYNSETMFIPVDDVFNTSNTKEMNYQSITGGILWKF